MTMNPFTRMFPFALLLSVSGSCGEQSPTAGKRQNVILICMDTVRADHIGAYGYKDH
ncbi:MAG: glucan phosphoethanolaminetransferase (alkaline phosphatase superfamily), partial [Candidatus Paceibacteria bacterium]